MIDQEELIFTVDENNIPIRAVLRTEAHKKGVWHRTTDIVVINTRKDILCNKRSMLKDTGPGMWDCSFGGHIEPLLDPFVGAIRELQEESGLEIDKNNLKFIEIFKHAQGNNKEFRYFYVYHWDGDVNQLNYEKDEISQLRWFSINKLREEIIDKKKWSPAPYFDKLNEYITQLI